MTLKEAKDILKKEFAVIGLHKSTEPFEFDDSHWFRYEKPSVLEAFRVLAKEGYYVTISGHDYNMRKERLKKEYEENTKAPGSDENSIKGDLSGNESIEHCGEPIPGSPLSAVEGIKSKLKDNQNTSENPALKESASQFNDALLDEQAKKIKRLGKEIARLNKIIHKKNLKIEELGKESSRHLEGKIKMFGENVDLEQMLKDKDAVLSDVAEELRLSKIREKNLTEVSQKYMKENEELKKKLADKVVEKIDDVQAFKNAESALAWKDRVIYYKDMAIAYNEKEIADLGKELKEKTKLVEMIRNASKEYCDYGVAANEFIKELASLYVLANNKGIINDEILERCKNYQTYDFPANCNRETKKEINDIARGKTKVVGADNAEEGGDHSGVIVLCGKDFVKKFKENEDLVHDLFEKKYKEIIEVMSIESKQLFEGDGIPTKMEAVKPSQRFKQSVCDARLELLYFIS